MRPWESIDGISLQVWMDLIFISLKLLGVSLKKDFEDMELRDFIAYKLRSVHI